MTIASFEALCNGIADIAGVTPPKLEPDATGTIAFRLDIDEIPVTVLQVPSRTDAAFFVAEFGPMPEANALKGWRALMEANLEMTASNGPVFGRDRASGAVTFHLCRRIDEIAPVDAYQCASGMAHMAVSWRRTHFISDFDLEAEFAPVVAALAHMSSI